MGMDKCSCNNRKNCCCEKKCHQECCDHHCDESCFSRRCCKCRGFCKMISFKKFKECSKFVFKCECGHCFELICDRYHNCCKRECCCLNKENTIKVHCVEKNCHKKKACGCNCSKKNKCCKCK